MSEDLDVEPMDTAPLFEDFELRVRGDRSHLIELGNVLDLGMDAIKGTSRKAHPGWRAAYLTTDPVMEVLGETLQTDDVLDLPEGVRESSADDLRGALDVDVRRLDAPIDLKWAAERAPLLKQGQVTATVRVGDEKGLSRGDLIRATTPFEDEVGLYRVKAAAQTHVKHALGVIDAWGARYDIDTTEELLHALNRHYEDQGVGTYTPVKVLWLTEAEE